VAGRGQGVVFFSLELDPHDLLKRQAAAETGYDLNRIQARKIEAQEQAYLDEFNRLADLPIHIPAKAGISASGMLQHVRRAADRFGRVALIVVDYSRYLSPNHRVPDNYSRFQAIMQEFTQLLHDHLNPDGSRPAGLMITPMRKNQNRSVLPTTDELLFGGQYEAGSVLLLIDPKDYLASDYDFDLVRDGNNITPNFGVDELNELFAAQILDPQERVGIVPIHRNGQPCFLRGLRYIENMTRWETIE
jgi:hypothetical protein